MPRRHLVFDAVVRKAGISPYVEVPADPAFTGPEGRAVLVRVRAPSAPDALAGLKTARDRDRLIRIGRMTVGGWFRTHIVPTGRGRHRLFLDTWMRDSAGVGVGDTVTVTVTPDRQVHELSIPTPLRTALQKDSAAKRAWDAQSPSRKKETLSYLNFLKSPEAIDRTVRKVLAELRR